MVPAAVVPSLWSALHGWFTPAVLFVLVNLVIGTIAVASRSMSAAGAREPGDGEGPAALLRAPSFAFDRLRSFSFSRLPATEPFGGEVEPEPSLAMAAGLEGEDEDEQEHGHEQAHIERSRSEAAAGEAPAPRLPARMRRSASEMSASAHFAPAAEEEAVAVEARRPATTRDAAGSGVAHYDDDYNDDDEESPPPPVEVDARADDFIRQFREQLRLQRLDSVLRRRDMLRRGDHAGATG